MRALVIVISDLYLQLGDVPDEAAAAAMPGLEFAGRFGERERLAGGGWRGWLARWLGRADLAGASVAGVAAASLTNGAGAPTTRWIATPVELVAGLTRLHLDRRGIVRLAPTEQAALVSSFQRAFGGAGLTLEALGDGQLLLGTPLIAALETAEPARCAGGDIEVPQGRAAAPLLRLMGEIEMWLHAETLNEARRARGAPPVTGLWLWGAAGGAIPAHGMRHPAPAGAGRAPPVAFGSDAWLAGLCRLEGLAAHPLPERAEALLAGPHAEGTVLVVEAAGEAPEGGTWSLPAAVAALDQRLIAPALAALERGALGRLTLVANDTRVTLGRHSALKRWRRRRAGLAAFG